MNLRNVGNTVVAAQLRVFRWSQIDGVDRLEPASEVVASPPAVTLDPQANYTVRIIRLDKSSVEREEAYRLMVDELPDSNRVRNGSINLVMRYSIPIFFTPASAEPPQLQWNIDHKNGRAGAVVSNEGGRRVRLSNMKVKDSSGRTVNFGDGLVGYVLSGSTMRLSASQKKAVLAPGKADVSTASDLGDIHAQAVVHR